MSQKLDSEIAVIGIDIGKNSFHLVGQDRHGRIVLRQKWSRGAVAPHHHRVAKRANRASLSDGIPINRATE